jgi:hypothetical protein
MNLLAIVGTLMLVDTFRDSKKKTKGKKKLHEHNWFQGLPLRMRFPKSRLYESALTPILLGLIVGFVASMMGIGGAFLMVPAMIYIVGMPVKFIPGTSLFVTIFISAIVTVLHAFNYGSIDLFLVIPLIFGSIVGVQLGQKLGQYLDSDHLKSLFALLLCSVAVAIAYDSFLRDKTELNTTQTIESKLSPLAEFSLKFNNEAPFLYGALAILLAIFLGALASWVRKIFSDVRKNKPKTEDVKFPVK